jgi:hypothetical protein
MQHEPGSRYPLFTRYPHPQFLRLPHHGLPAIRTAFDLSKVVFCKTGSQEPMRFWQTT